MKWPLKFNGLALVKFCTLHLLSFSPPYFIPILPLASAPFSYVKTDLDAIRLYRRAQKIGSGVYSYVTATFCPSAPKQTKTNNQTNKPTTKQTKKQTNGKIAWRRMSHRRKDVSSDFCATSHNKRAPLRAQITNHLRCVSLWIAKSRLLLNSKNFKNYTRRYCQNP